MRTSTMLAAAGLAAAATYFFDPDQGRRRRARLRDKVYSKLSHADEAGAVVAIDLRNRLLGTYAAMRQRLRPGDVPGEVLVERVRARLGRFLSHPASVEVTASQGTVTLQGPVLTREQKRAVRAVAAVPGVCEVVDRLEPHEQQADIPGLQGGKPRVQRPDILQERWAPATRALVGAGGASLVACALARRSPLAALLGLAGTAMVLRAATNMNMRRLLGQRGASIDFIKTVHLAAPVGEVFAFWQNFENFPKFMRNVRSVHKNKEDDWHWEVAGPLGTVVQWDAVVTESIPDQLIAWATTPGSQVEHAGIVNFQEEGDGTRLQIEMSYNPPGAAFGHVVASFFGADPLSEMDEDLMRLKSYFESGKPARDAARAAPVPA